MRVKCGAQIVQNVIGQYRVELFADVFGGHPLYGAHAFQIRSQSGYDRYTLYAKLALFADEAVALMASDVLGNKEFIKRFTKSQRSWAQRFLSKIIEVKEAFGRVTDSNARKEYRRFVKAEQIWKEALNELGARYVAGKIMMNGAEDDDADIDVDSEKSYNENASAPQESRKDQFIGRTFPTYSESRGSQANELATRWAHRADIKAGDQAAISFQDKWYLIEKVDDADWGYQIIAQMTEKQYQEYTEDRENVAEKQSLQESVGEITSINRRAGSADGGVVSDNSLSSRNRRGDSKVQQLGQEQARRGETQRNGSGDSESSSSGEQSGVSRAKFSLKGTTQDGIEIYETSKDIRSLTNAEKRKLFVQQMRNEYRDRLAKFTVDGKVYYASFAREDVKKLAYGDINSDTSGKKAKLNVGASGDIFDLVENAKYWGSSPERGKNTQAHKNVGSWDYFVKTVEIDGIVYDEVVNVRKKGINEYVYDISLNEKVTSSPNDRAIKPALISSKEVTSTDSIRKNSKNVNTSNQKNAKFSRKDAEGNKTHYRKSDIGAILDAVASDIVAEHTKNTLIHLYDFENNYSTTRR